MNKHNARKPSKPPRPAVWIGVASALGLVALVAVVLLPTESTDAVDESLPVSMVEMAFVPEDVRARPGQEISVTNDGAVRHSLLVVGLGKGVEMGPGEARSFTLPEGTTGTYRLICDIPGHIEAGMVGTMTISDAEVTSETIDRD